MKRWYFICEKLSDGKGKFLSVIRGKANGRKVLGRFALKTRNEVYLMDILTHEIVLRLNP